MGYRLWRAVGNLPSMCLPVSAVPFHSRIGDPLPTVLRYQFLGEGRGTWVFIGTLLRIPPRPWWRQDDALATSLPCTCNWPALRASKPGAPISLCRHGNSLNTAISYCLRNLRRARIRADAWRYLQVENTARTAQPPPPKPQARDVSYAPIGLQELPL